MSAVLPCFMFPDELRDQVVAALVSAGQMTREGHICDLVRDLDEVAYKRGTPKKPGSDPSAPWKSDRHYATRWAESRRYVRELFASLELRAWFRVMCPKKVFPKRTLDADDPPAIHQRSTSGPRANGSKRAIRAKWTTRGPLPIHKRSSDPRKQSAKVANQPPDHVDHADPIDPPLKSPPERAATSTPPSGGSPEPVAAAVRRRRTAVVPPEQLELPEAVPEQLDPPVPELDPPPQPGRNAGAATIPPAEERTTSGSGARPGSKWATSPPAERQWLVDRLLEAFEGRCGWEPIDDATWGRVRRGDQQLAEDTRDRFRKLGKCPDWARCWREFAAAFREVARLHDAAPRGPDPLRELVKRDRRRGVAAWEALGDEDRAALRADAAAALGDLLPLIDDEVTREDLVVEEAIDMLLRGWSGLALAGSS